MVPSALRLVWVFEVAVTFRIGTIRAGLAKINPDSLAARDVSSRAPRRRRDYFCECEISLPSRDRIRSRRYYVTYDAVILGHDQQVRATDLSREFH